MNDTYSICLFVLYNPKENKTYRVILWITEMLARGTQYLKREREQYSKREKKREREVIAPNGQGVNLL